METGKLYSVIGELGNRYMLYHLDSEEDRRETALKAISDEGVEEIMRNEISIALKKALNNAPKAEQVVIPESIQLKLASLAELTSQMRSPVSRNPYDKTVNYMPDIEGPPRLAKSFVKLGKGLAAIRGKLEMTEDEYELIKKIALDTVPRRRKLIVSYLISKEWKNTKLISSDLDIPISTITLDLEDLMLVKVVRREPDLEDGADLKQTTPYRWQLRNKIAGLIEDAELIEQLASY
jgi:hypothetical protein